MISIQIKNCSRIEILLAISAGQALYLVA